MYQRTYKQKDAEVTYRNEDWLRNEYISKGRSIKDISTECGISHTVLERYLKNFGIRKRANIRDVVKPTKSELEYLHLELHLTPYKIASMFEGVGENTILKLMQEYGIERIDGSTLLSEWWAKEENKKRMSEIRANFWNDKEYREHNLEHLRNKDKILKRAIKYSARYQNISEAEWEGFLTPERTRIRGSTEYVKWRKSVFERDDYTCQCCGDRSRSGHPVFLHAHHLECFSQNDGLRFDVNNGITLCYNCHDVRAHGSFHNLYGTRNNTREQFLEFMASRARKDRDIEE